MDAEMHTRPVPKQRLMAPSNHVSLSNYLQFPGRLANSRVEKLRLMYMKGFCQDTIVLSLYTANEFVNSKHNNDSNKNKKQKTEMESYFSTLVNELAIKDVVIVRDDAVSTSSIRPEFIPPMSLKQSNAASTQQRPSLTNASERNASAPKLPYRKSSSDDLLLKRGLDGGRSRSRSRRSSLNEVLDSTAGQKLSPERRNRRQLFNEIFAEVDTLIEESQKRGRYVSHAA